MDHEEGETQFNDAFITVIEDLIEGSFFRKDSMQLGYTLTSIEPIKSDQMTNSFNKKKSDLKETCKENNLIERDLFYVVYDRGEVDLVKSKGFECVRSEELEQNVLGTSGTGLHFGKHLDLVLRNEYRKRTREFYCILTKVILNTRAICTVTVNLKTEPPKAGYQCLVSNELADQSQQTTVQNLNSMMYIYEYNADGSINPRPQNILPHAVLKYQLTNPNVHDCTIYQKPCQQQQQQTSTKNTEDQTNTSLSFSFNESDTSASAPPPLLAFSTETPALTEPELVIPQKKPPMKKKFSFSKRASLFNEEEPQRSSACQLDRHFQPVQQITEVIDSTNNDSIQSYFKNEVVYERLPRWRQIFEKHGIKNILFKSKLNLTVRLVNIYTKVKFLNEKRRIVDLKDPINKFLLPIKQVSEDTTNKTAKPISKPKKTDQSVAKKEEASKSKKSEITKISSSVNRTKTPIVTNTSKESVIKTQSKSSTLNADSNKTTPSTGIKTPTVNKMPKTVPSVKTKTSTSHGSSPLIKAALVPTQKPTKSAAGTPETKSKTINSESKASGSSKSTPNDEDIGLSSEMTSLEKRLLGLDKAKTIAKAKAEASSKSDKFNSLSANLEKVSQNSNKMDSLTSSASAKAKLKELESKANAATAAAATAKPKMEMPKKPKNIQEELRKISAKLNQEKKSMRIGQDISKTTVVNTSGNNKVVSPMAKRKKSFWDPDSDTEYDRLVKKNSSASKKLKTKKNETDPKEEDEDNEESDSYNEEYVIVSKQHLNIQPVQYSKQYYDLNMNGLENELKRFSPSQNSLSPHTHGTVTKHIKAPITTAGNPTKQPIKAESQQDRNSRGNQKFIHHYVTQTAHYRYQDYQRSKLATAPTFTETVINQFDVDSLKNLKRKSTSNINGLADQQIETICHEIHAGGFRSIEDHHFQKSENYLRRTRSFSSNQNNRLLNSPYDTKLNLNLDQSMSNDSYIEKHQRKISLNEYANIRAKSSDVSTPQQPMSNFNSYPNSVNSGDVNVNDENLNAKIKNEKIIKSPASSDSPANRSFKNVRSPPDLNKSDKSSLSLQVELKKRIGDQNQSHYDPDDHTSNVDTEYTENGDDNHSRLVSESDDSSRCSNKRKHIRSKRSKTSAKEKRRRIKKRHKSTTTSIKKRHHSSSKKLRHSKHSRRSKRSRSGSDSSNSELSSDGSCSENSEEDNTSVSSGSSLSISSGTDLSDGLLTDTDTDANISSSGSDRSTSRSSVSSPKRKSSAKKKSHKSSSKKSKKRQRLSRDRSRHKVTRSRKSSELPVAKEDTYDDGECTDSEDNVDDDDGYSIDPDLEDNLKLLTNSQRSDMSFGRNRNQTPDLNQSGCSYKSIESTPWTTTSSNNSRSNTPMQMQPLQHQYQQKREGKEKHPTRQFFTPNMAGKRVPNAAFVNTSLPPPMTNFNGAGFPPVSAMLNNSANVPNDSGSNNSMPKFNRNQFNNNQKFNSNSNNIGPVNVSMNNLPANAMTNQQSVGPSNFIGNNNNSFNDNMNNTSLNNSATSNFAMNESFGPSNNSMNNYYPNNNFDSSFNSTGQNMSMNYPSDANSSQNYHKPQMQASSNNGNNSFNQSPIVPGNANNFANSNKGNNFNNRNNNNRNSNNQQFTNNNNMKNNPMMNSFANMDPVAMQNFFNQFVQSMGPNFNVNMANFDPVMLQNMIMQFMSSNNIDASMFNGNYSQNNFNNFNFNSPAFRNNFNKMFNNNNNNTGNNQFNNYFPGQGNSSGNGFESSNNASNNPIYNDSPGFISNNMNTHRATNYNGNNNNNNMNNSFNSGNVCNNFNTPKNNNFQKNKGNKFNTNNRNNNNNNNRMTPKNSQTPQNFNNRGFNQQMQGQSGMMKPSLAPHQQQQSPSVPKPAPVDLEDGEID